MRQIWKTWLVVTACVVASAAVVLSYSSQAGSFAAEVPKEVGFIGDSITQGPKDTSENAVTAEMEILGDEYTAINRGVSGKTTKDWLPGGKFFDEALLAFKTRNVQVVSIMLGTNDARKKTLTSPGAYEQNMRTIISALLESGTVKWVIVNSPPYVAASNWNKEQLTLLREYMARLEKVAELPGVVKGDSNAYEYFKENPHLLEDGVHPTAEGYRVLGELWAQAFQRSVAQPKTLVAFTPLSPR